MTKNERQRCITNLFQTISNEERMQIEEKELAQVRESNKDATCSRKKREMPICKPKMQHNVNILSEHKIKKEDNESNRPSKLKKKQGAHQNWFQPYLWSQILVVVKKYGNNKIVLTFMQNAYKSQRVFSLYAMLTMGTMWEWFTKESELKKNYMEDA